MILKDRVVVITGGAGLLGRAFCHAVAENGGVAIVAELDQRRGEEVASQLNAKGLAGRAEFAHIDINNHASIGRVIKSLSRRFGTIDALVNNAYPRNKRYGRKFEDVALADFTENVALHLGGYFLATQLFIKFFRKQGHGNIINMASVYGMIAPRFQIYRGTQMTMPVEYAVLKAGILQLTKYLSKYLRGSNIRVNAISPGGVRDRQPVSFLKAYSEFCLSKGMLDNEDVCGALLFLLSDLSKFVNGHALVVDDGFSL